MEKKTKKQLIEEYIWAEMNRLADMSDKKRAVRLKSLRPKYGDSGAYSNLFECYSRMPEWLLGSDAATKAVCTTMGLISIYYQGQPFPCKQIKAYQEILRKKTAESEERKQAIETQKSKTLGKAVALCVKQKKQEYSVDDAKNTYVDKFKRILNLPDYEAMEGILFNLIKLIKSTDICLNLDFAGLAGNLYDLQFDSTRRRVAERWYKDYFLTLKANKENTQQEDE